MVSRKNGQLDRNLFASYNLPAMAEHDEPPATAAYSPEKGSLARASVLGPSVKLNGEWLCAENVVVAGQLKGKIDVGNHDLRIEEIASVQAEIRGKNITVLGKVTGNITASGKITVGKEARMIGDLSAPQIAIQDGARFKGIVKMRPPEGNPESPHKK